VVVDQRPAGYGADRHQRPLGEGAAPTKPRRWAAALLVWYVLLIAIATSAHHSAGFYWSLGLNGTLIALAAIWAGRSAIHKSWQQVALAVAVALIAAVGAIAGPRGMWLVNDVGLCVLLLANAAIGTWQRRGTRTHTVRTGA
jgi:hypothetical protein